MFFAGGFRRSCCSRRHAEKLSFAIIGRLILNSVLVSVISVCSFRFKLNSSWCYLGISLVYQ